MFVKNKQNGLNQPISKHTVLHIYKKNLIHGYSVSLNRIIAVYTTIRIGVAYSWHSKRAVFTPFWYLALPSILLRMSFLYMSNLEVF